MYHLKYSKSNRYPTRRGNRNIRTFESPIKHVSCMENAVDALSSLDTELIVQEWPERIAVYLASLVCSLLELKDPGSRCLLLVWRIFQHFVSPTTHHP